MSNLTIYGSLMSKIKGFKPLSQNEKLVHSWSFGKNLAHAGQILSSKVLPNGNKKVRLVTAFAGDGRPIGLETKLYSPSNKLLEVYAGIRQFEKTKAMSGDSSSLDKIRHFAAETIYDGNPSAKKLI